MTASLDEPVRVENEDRADRQLDRLLTVFRLDPRAQREPSSRLEQLDSPVWVRDDGGRMTGAREPADARSRIQDDVGEGRERGIERILGESVEALENRTKASGARPRMRGLRSGAATCSQPPEHPSRRHRRPRVRASRRGVATRRTSRRRRRAGCFPAGTERRARRRRHAEAKRAGHSAAGSPRLPAPTRSDWRGRAPVRPGQRAPPRALARPAQAVARSPTI